MIGEQAVLIEVAEHRRQREVVPLGDRIILVVVAARALHREAHEAVAGGHHPVVDAVLTEFLGDGAAFEGHAVQPVESGRHPLVLRRTGQEVAGELLGQELVVRLVLIERLQHPVAPRPGEHRFVARVAPGIGVTRQVEPADGQMLAETRRREQRVHPAFEGVGRVVGEEGVDLLGRRRQSRQGEGGAAEELGALRGRGRPESGGFDAGEDEAVQRVLRPGRVLDRRHGVGARRSEAPVRFILRALLHPAGQDVFFGGGQRPVELRRRHHVFRVFRADAFDHLALLEVAGDHGAFAALEFLRRAFRFVETQAGLAAFVRIRAVAAVATVGQQRPYVAVEVDGLIRGEQGDAHDEREESDEAERHEDLN